jgi:hypothetical protein
MTLFQMAAAIAACDAAMILEKVDEPTRARVLDRFGKSVAQLALREPPLPIALMQRQAE